jgi:hypothetical protein
MRTDELLICCPRSTSEVLFSVNPTFRKLGLQHLTRLHLVIAFMKTLSAVLSGKYDQWSGSLGHPTCISNLEGVVKNKMSTRKARAIEDQKIYIDDAIGIIDKDCGFSAYIILSIYRPVRKIISV